MGVLGAFFAAAALPLASAAAAAARGMSCDKGCAVGPNKAVSVVLLSCLCRATRHNSRRGAALCAQTTNMNGDYTVAGDPKGFSTISADYDKGNVEYFDVYSPLVQTRYSQVYWTMMPSVPLPPALVKRFEGKVMAITGWEGDQVWKGADGEADTSVPITWAYNHHYGSYINGKDSVLEQVELQGHDDPNGYMGHASPGDMVWTTRARDGDSNASSHFPASTVFATGNGGEYRKVETQVVPPQLDFQECI